MGPRSYMRSVVDRNVFMQRIPVVVNVFLWSMNYFPENVRRSTLACYRAFIDLFHLQN